MSFYPSSLANVNNQYLTYVFCVAETQGLRLPVYQIDYTPESDYKNLVPNSVKEYILMICGNENHESVDFYLNDPRVKMIVKNYPRMINCAADVPGAYEYNVKRDTTTGRQRFVIEREKENILTIPLGSCNNYNPLLNYNKNSPGGFVGQWTQFRQEKVEKIINSFGSDICPYDWAFYKGFGPFVQSDTSSDWSSSLDTQTYSNFMSKSEVAFVLSGQSPETYRLFEAAMAGCIIVHDNLPDIWYYKELPYVPLQPESFIAVHDYIQANKKDLKSHTASWYQRFASPVAVGKKIAQTAKHLGI